MTFFKKHAETITLTIISIIAILISVILMIVIKPKCPACGAKYERETNSKENYCTYCGHDLKNRCPDCGSKNKRTAKNCSKCGTKLYDNEEPKIEERS